MDLNSGRVITRRKIKVIPVTDLVIQAVEQMAIQQGIHTLKITGRTSTPSYPADWIAGVDYNNQTQQRLQDEDYIEEEEEAIDTEIYNDLVKIFPSTRSTHFHIDHSDQIGYC
jgi:thiamine phosphate synthase YjbQ (UPF0047 family)